MCFFLLLSHCQKQDVTALSSTKGSQRRFLEELPQIKLAVLNADNQSTIKLITSDSYRSKTKHIDMRYPYVLERFTGGTLQSSFFLRMK